MKVWSKEALVLGGTYSASDILCSLLGLEFIRNILVLLFILYSLMLFFNKSPTVISYIITNHPQISHYLSAIGWIPYTVMILFFIATGLCLWLGCNDEVIIGLVSISLAVFAFLSGIISLIVAYIRAKTKASD